MLALAAVVSAAAAAQSGPTPSVEIAPGVMYPVVQLGTCCGSDPKVGLAEWVKQQEAGGIVAIDTAYGYKDQPAIAAGLKALGKERKDVWITTKIPPGVFCKAADPAASVLELIQENLHQLNVSYVDLTLVHSPCDRASGKSSPLDLKAWKGMMEAVAKGWTRAIGVDDYTAAQIEGLTNAGLTKPAVNMCSMSMKRHDDATIAYCQANGITYNAFGVMKGCEFSHPTVVGLAKKYQTSTAQICAVWTRQRGCTMSLGTGSDPSKIAEYTKEDLDIFSFNMTATEVEQLNKLH